jgi:hypothetical protein
MMKTSSSIAAGNSTRAQLICSSITLTGQHVGSCTTGVITIKNTTTVVVITTTAYSNDKQQLLLLYYCYCYYRRKGRLRPSKAP